MLVFYWYSMPSNDVFYLVSTKKETQKQVKVRYDILHDDSLNGNAMQM